MGRDPKIEKRIEDLRSYAEAPDYPCGDKNKQNYKKKIKRQNQKN